MATLIAVDGNSLNYGLQKLAQSRAANEKQTRFRIDHQRLADLLAQPEPLSKVSLRFYTDDQKIEDNVRPMGRIFKYFPNKGYGFISGTDGRSYFFHHNELVNKKALCDGNEDRYPHPASQEFKDRTSGRVVTFNAVVGEDNRFKAEEIRFELAGKALDRYYQLRREPFFQMLEESGYKLVRCRQSRHASKSKNVDGRIILDALVELEDGDHLVLLSDDPIYTDLIEKLLSRGVKVTVATFKVSRSEEIREAVTSLAKNPGGNVLLLDDHLDDIQLEYEDFDEEDLDDSSEHTASITTTT
jgi:uncharacterized LabA/DUF88 family protein